MFRWKFILSAVVVFVSAGFVRADMAGPSCLDAPRVSDSTSVVKVEGEIGELSSDKLVTSESIRLGSLEVAIHTDLPGNLEDENDRATVRVLPGTPSSFALFLSALSGLGAWQLGRSARKFHLSSVPHWYHTGGPVQVGHVSAINPDFTTAATIRVCDLLAERPLRLLLRRAVPLGLRSQCIPALATPRAPPLFCF